MNVYSAQKFFVRLLVILFVLLILCAMVLSAKAESSYQPAFIPPHVDNKPCCPSGIPCQDTLVYLSHDCKVENGIQPARKNHKHSNTGTTPPAIQPVNTPPAGNGGNDDTPPARTHHDHGNHYGNEREDNNCKDVKNRHNTCKPQEDSIPVALFVVLLLSSGKKIYMDGVKDVASVEMIVPINGIDKVVNGVELTAYSGDDIARYNVPLATIQKVYRSEADIHGNFEMPNLDDWKGYRQD